MIERLERLLGMDDEPQSAARQLSVIQAKATDRQAFHRAFRAGDYEQMAEHHEWSAERLEAELEETVDV